MEHLWDEFSKSLAESVPRRESLRRLGAVLAGAVLAPVGLGTTWARGPVDPCKAFCNQCPKKNQSQCLNACRSCSGNTSRLCGGCGTYACINVANDFYNCGSCGNVCNQTGPNEVGACANGQCVYECVSGATRCNGTCTFVSSNPYHCGACNMICPAETPYCNQGVCSDQGCPGGLTYCSGYCRDLYHDPVFCGSSCDTAVVCGLYENCTGGVCVPNDPPPPECS